MRTEKEMMDLILDTAKKDDRVRAVILNGSRANPDSYQDIFSDYDVVYVVENIDSFTSDHGWVDIFGDRLMIQMPEDKVIPPASHDGSFVYLMLFSDGNRIDLTLVPIGERDRLIGRDSLRVLLLDKDGIIEPFPPPSETDYVVKQPSLKEFADCCNDFWWVSTYIAKGLWRQELPYAKGMFVYVRDMLILMLKWHIGIKTGFVKSVGIYGKYLERYLESEVWNEFVETYPNGDYENIWKSLFAMCNLFRKIALHIADHFSYMYPYDDDKRITSYLRHVKLLPSSAKEVY